MCIVGQIMDIIPKWFHLFIHDSCAIKHYNMFCLFTHYFLSACVIATRISWKLYVSWRRQSTKVNKVYRWLSSVFISKYEGYWILLWEAFLLLISTSKNGIIFFYYDRSWYFLAKIPMWNLLTNYGLNLHAPCFLGYS
jgi:hypothetical protein